jgi:hypothetical protein
MRTTDLPCSVPGCDKRGMLKKHCHAHYVTLIYRKRPEVKSRYSEMNRTTRARFNRGKSMSGRHGVEWTVTREEYAAMIESGCYYCEADLSSETGRGLDRIDTHKGYTPDNVVPCCARCNVIRGQRFTPEELKIMIAALKSKAV